MKNCRRENDSHLHGGGDTVRAGTNITITVNADGTKTINSTGGGGGSTTFYTETPAGAVNGINTVYTVLHSINTVVNFAINGQYIHPSAYSVSGSTITFVTALDASLSGLLFTIVYTSGTTPPATSHILTESGDGLLTEDGNNLSTE